MKPSNRLALVALFMSLMYAPSVCADPLARVEAAALVGAASNPGWIANPYALGFGGRAGIDVYGFYGGLSALYYVGGSFGGSGFHTLLLGAEVGYTINLPRLRIRPKVGLGDGTFTQSASDGVYNPPISTSVGNLYLEPGVVVLVPVGPVFLGADAGALILPHFTLATTDPVAKTYASFSAHAQVGVVF